MAKNDESAPTEAAEGEQAEKVVRKPSRFKIQVRTEQNAPWTVLDQEYEAITQDDAKRDAARALAEADGPYKDAILSTGLELVAVSARGWKPIVVKVEPQPAKLVLGASS